MVRLLCKQKWPGYAKLMDKPVLPQPQPQPKLKPKPEQPISGQKLPKPEPEPEPKKIGPKVDTPDSVLDLAEATSRKQETIPKRKAAELDSSSLSEDPLRQKAPEAKLEGPCKGLDKAVVARIQEAMRKRKSMAKICPTSEKVQLDASSEELEDWIERELESGIVARTKPVGGKRKAECKNEVIVLDTSCEYDDLWIERELEEGIIVDSKPVGTNKMNSTGESSAALKLDNSSVSKNAWRRRKREAEEGIDLGSKRQWR